MSGPSPRLSRAGSHRFSREGFVQLTSVKSKSEKERATNDVMVDIPMGPMGKSAEAGLPLHQQPTFPKSSQDEKSGMFHHRPGGRRVKRRVGGPDEIDPTSLGGEQDTLTQMGKFYKKILNFSFITRYIVFIVPLALVIAVPIVIGATAAKRASLGGVRLVWIFTWVEIVWLSLWVSKLFAQALPAIFQFLCGIVSSGTRKYALVLKRLEIPLSLVGWALASLATFIPLMTRNPDQRAAARQNPAANDIQPWQRIVNQLLAATLVASLIFLAERLLIQVISINYHRRQFESRIKTSKRNIHLLGLLYEASRTLFPAYCSEFAEEDYIINGSIAAGSTATRAHQRSGSVTPMRLIQNVGRVGDKITAAFGNMASEITGKQIFNPTSAHSVVVEALEKRKSSEALAKRIWMSFVVEGKDSLYLEDVIEVLGTDRQVEAEEAFFAIDKDCNGDISLDEMIIATVELGRERSSIATSLGDVDQAINVLDKLLCTIVFIIVVFVFVAFLNASFTTTLATAGAALLSMSFAFATTVQEVLGSCIFLFVKTPYNAGDRVDINGDQFTVEHISLLYSVFRRVDNHKIVQSPHIVLNQCWIDNVSRSKAMKEQIKIYINFDTTLEDINLLKNEMQAFVLDKDNSREFLPEVDVEVTGIAEMNKLELKIELRHKSNWSNETLRAARRSKFMCALVLALRRIPIYAPGGGDAVLGDISKPTYSVAISDAQAAANRDAFAAEKDAKRLFPTSKSGPKRDADDNGKSTGTEYFGVKSKPSVTGRTDTRPSTSGASEKTAVEALALRNPAEDSARDDWESYREDMTTTPGGRTVADARRGNAVEEVRGMLRRESTRGRRRAGGATGASGAAAVPAIVEVQTPPLRRTSAEGERMTSEFDQWHIRRDGHHLSQESGIIPAALLYASYQHPSDSSGDRVVVGNAFARAQQLQQQQQQQQQQSQQMQSQPRRQSPTQSSTLSTSLYTSMPLPQAPPPSAPPPQRPPPRDP